MYDIFSNPKLKAIMTLYIVMMGFDLVGRVFLSPQPQVQPTTDQAAASASSTVTGADVNAEPQAFAENGDAIPIDRTGFEGGSRGVYSDANVHVSFCVGCQYNQAFNKLKEQLNAMGIDNVTADEYPIEPTKKLLGNLVSYSHWGILILLMFGDKLLPAIGVVPPPIYYKLKEKQWMVIIGSYFLTSQLSNSLLNSGAFEVYLNGELVHSKLTSKQMPDPLVLAGMIKRMLTQ